MSERTISLPVRATMCQQADGHFAMVNAEYVTVDAAAVASYIVNRLGLAAKGEYENGNARQAANE